uniref:Putative secreted protein n=1 Tax=Anopheles marajoara TaxID=58244 RepID=A0A2M4CAF5_9DIPT
MESWRYFFFALAGARGRASSLLVLLAGFQFRSVLSKRGTRRSGIMVATDRQQRHVRFVVCFTPFLRPVHVMVDRDRAASCCTMHAK